MVVFTCGHCGESVQKPKVEKHYQMKCRNLTPNLSCMDCFKDFLGKAYESHTKCITEEERYSGKGFMAKEKKGEKKQNTWVEMVQEVLDEQKSAPKNVLRIIETVAKFNNTPRKKPKFINFVKNVCGPKTNPKDIDQAWDIIAVKLAALSLQNKNKNNKDADANNKSEKNGDDSLANGKDDEKENLDNSTEKVQNGEDDEQIPENGETGAENNEDTEGSSNKKLSKKQRKEEKKRQKYEAELKSAIEQPPEEEEIQETQPTKKGKKKKTKSESNNDTEETQDSKNKKKRKRQDTANSVSDTHENGNVENEPVVTKASKKKLKVQEDEEAEESICLHDQNVAKIEELTMNSEKFNWHAVIISVLQKKDNEVPFKRLQKKVLMEYSEATGQDVDDRIAEKFIKKLKSAPNVRVDKNRVLLLE